MNRMNALGYLTFLRTYARTKDDGYLETYDDTINRVLRSCNKDLKCNFDETQIEELRYLFKELKCSVAGRFLWQMGTETVNKLGLMSLQNCAFTKIENYNDFCWIFDLLLLGCGVGVNIQKDKIDLPKPKYINIELRQTKDADYIVPDSREGFVFLLEMLLKNHFTVNGRDFTFNTKFIRPSGHKLSDFGGISRGDKLLIDGIYKLNKFINSKAEENLSPTDIGDIISIIADIVVSGNIRRSAVILIGDGDDKEYINAKNWSSGNIPNYRCNTNNSIVCNDINEILENNIFWDNFLGSAEPYGLINLKLAKSCGRTGEIFRKDDYVEGCNPCAEQMLYNKETCCLCEVFLPNIQTKQEFLKCLKYLYIICKKSLTLKCHWKETDNVIKQNMRMGIGITGYLDSTDKQKSWLNDGYCYLRKLDYNYSTSEGINESIKITTVKPSGTLSLLGDCSAGIHPRYSKYYIRRVRFDSNSPLLDILYDNGYKVEDVVRFDGTIDTTTKIGCFPCKAKESSILSKDITAIHQLEIVKKMQKTWSDNAVSNTIYYRKDELADIKKWLKLNYNDNIKSCSFLLHSDHGFKQAPYEEITEEQYNEMMKYIKEIDMTKPIKASVDYDLMDECANGACPVR